MSAVREEGGYLDEAPKRTPIIAEVDVLVVGGGPSGVAAAIGAAQSGAKTMLIERHGSLGGMWTAGLVITLAGFNSWLRPYTRCVDGVGGMWLRRAASMGFAQDDESWALNSDPEGMKLVADALLEEHGVRCLFHTWCATAIVKDNLVTGAIVENVDGRSAILAKVTVDATGNGDVVARSGAEWVKGKTLQPMTMPFRMVGARTDPGIAHLAAQTLPIGPDPIEVSGTILVEKTSLRPDVQLDVAAMQQSFSRGEIPLFGGPWFGGIDKDVVWVNTTRIVGDGSIAEELTRAEITGRKESFSLLGYFKTHIQGFENARIVQTGPQIGIRETRRLVGAYTLTGNDIRDQIDFDDGIGLGCWPIDVHTANSVGYHALYAPRPYSIPYRALLPKTLDGLLTAGRCISADREALASIRVGATCTVTGHAAGTAAALSVATRVPPRQVDRKRLAEMLESQGALLGSGVHSNSDQ